jgi:hypothetical protein
MGPRRTQLGSGIIAHRALIPCPVWSGGRRSRLSMNTTLDAGVFPVDTCTDQEALAVKGDVAPVARPCSETITAAIGETPALSLP